jgi:hypothetical protein
MLRSTHRKFAANFVFTLGCRLRLSAGGLGLAAICLGLAAISLGLAAVSPCQAAGPAGGSQGDRGASAPAAASTPRPDEAERRKIIDGPAWRAMQHDLMEWLSVQKVYTPSQLRRVKAELNAKVAKMSPQELVDFMGDMETKLKILMGPEAEQARLYMERRIAVQANLTPEQLKRMRPDVLNMTSAQLEERLFEWQQQRKQTIATQQAFDKGRQIEIKNIEAMEKDEEHERDEALNRAYYDMSNGSPYGSVYGGRRQDPSPGYYGMNGTDYFGGGYYGGFRW